MRLLVVAASVLAIGILVPGCGAIRKEILQNNNKDRIDYDFVANIRHTKDPYVFEIQVERVNNRADKSIGGPFSSGRSITHGHGWQTVPA